MMIFRNAVGRTRVHVVKVLSLLVALGVLIASGAGTAVAATRTVTSQGDTGPGSLRQAVAEAASGDTIVFDPALNGGTIRLTSGQIVLEKNLSIIGPGKEQLTISGNRLSRVLYVKSGTISIAALTIADGRITGSSVEEFGGGIRNDGNLTLTNVRVTNCESASIGGGIYNNGNSGSVTMRLEKVVVDDNRVDSATNNTFGGGIFNWHGNLVIKDSMISGNRATVTGSDLAGYGGGLYFLFGTVSISGSAISDNSASSAGGIRNIGATVSISGSRVSNNSATAFQAGGIHNISLGGNASMTIDSTTVSGNRAATWGGGVYNDSYNNEARLVLRRSTLSGNSATSFSGGGLVNLGRGGAAVFVVDTSTISGNDAAESGGGLFNYGYSSNPVLEIIGSTVSNNRADRDATGAGDGGGIRNFAESGIGATITFKNSIVAGNLKGSATYNDCSQQGSTTLTSLGYSVTGSGTGCPGGTGDVVTSSPGEVLTPLGNFGGTTATHALRAGSLAIDAVPVGEGGCVGTAVVDQRGMPRPQGAACDIGAYERGSVTGVTAIAGTPQASVIGNHFATPLTVRLADAVGGGVEGIAVLFSGPAGGPGIVTGGSVTSGSDGTAAFAAEANGAVGSYPVTGTAAGQTVTFLLSNVDSFSDSGAPETVISSGPSDPSPVSAPVFKFIASRPGSSFECSVDAGAYAPCTSPFTTPPLSDGRHGFSVRAKDAAGAVDPTPAAHSWSIDTVSTFAVPAGIPDSPSASSSATISVGGAGIVAYRYQLDGGVWSEERPVETVISLAGLADGAHVLALSGKTGTGSWQATPTTAFWTVDTTRPWTAIMAHPPAVSTASAGMFTFAASEKDVHFRCAVDGGALSLCSSPYVFTGLSDGSHTFTVTAIDMAGNTENPASSYAWLSDSSAPTGTLAINNGAQFTTTTAVSLAITATDRSGVGSMCIANGASCSSSEPLVGRKTWSLESGDGIKTVNLWLTDSLGTTAAVPISANIILDTTGPAVSLSTLADGGVTTDATLNVSGTATDANGLQSVMVNGVQVPVGAGGFFSTAVTLNEGENSIVLVAVDLPGNITGETRKIVLDRSAPAITVTRPADNSATNGASVELVAEVEANATVAITINGRPVPGVVRNGLTYNALIDLSYGVNTIEVAATDELGNRATVKRTVKRDDGAPSLAVTEPGRDIKTDRRSMTIKGEVADAISGVAVTVAIGAITHAPAVVDGKFEQVVDLPEERMHRLVVVATDEASNRTEVVRNIIQTRLGDGDGNGSISIVDALNAYLIYLGQKQPSDTDLLRCDLAPLGADGRPEGDGVVDVSDVVLIMRRVVGLINW